jgi:hypothetical protein
VSLSSCAVQHVTSSRPTTAHAKLMVKGCRILFGVMLEKSANSLA